MLYPDWWGWNEPPLQKEPLCAIHLWPGYNKLYKLDSELNIRFFAAEACKYPSGSGNNSGCIRHYWVKSCGSCGPEEYISHTLKPSILQAPRQFLGHYR